MYRQRPSLPFEAWYAAHYARQPGCAPDHVETIVKRIAVELSIGPTQLDPCDRLDELIGLPRNTKLGPDDCWSFLEEALPEFSIDTSWVTLDDVIKGTSKGGM